MFPKRPCFPYCAGSVTCGWHLALLSYITVKTLSSLGGLEPPTFRLTAERANRLRHRDHVNPIVLPLKSVTWWLNSNMRFYMFWMCKHIQIQSCRTKQNKVQNNVLVLQNFNVFTILLSYWYIFSVVESHNTLCVANDTFLLMCLNLLLTYKFRHLFLSLRNRILLG